MAKGHPSPSPSSPVSNPMANPPRASSPVSNPAPSPSKADQARQVANEARRQIQSVTRALRSTTKTTGEVAVLGGADYALLDLCPWCRKGLRRLINPPFCPYCHRDVLAWNEELQEEWEKQRKGLRASNKSEKKDKELELLRKIREEGVVTRTRTKKATNRE